MAPSPHQRKFRNVDERRQIVDETLLAMHQVGLTEAACPNVGKLNLILAEFTANVGNGRSFDGVIELPEIGKVIQYALPGRRIVKHFIRVSAGPVGPSSLVPTDTAKEQRPRRPPTTIL